ncbi:MAG: helix-hairpin-helix domain-containing protein [Pirellulales bacterium]|nr:helix-hairpin-helix domain-containing protein [Pirellulales bacterium]
MAPRPTQADDPIFKAALKRTDQIVVAVACAIALAAMAAYWYLHGGHRGERIEIDHAEPLDPHFLVDINEADWPELTQLPNVGEVLAKRIVEQRRTAGPFRNPADLLRVEGIGPRTLEQIEPYLMALPE